MKSTTPKAMAAATAELVRDASRRLSADLRDASRDLGNELRNMGSVMGREIRDIRREVGQRFRSSSLQRGAARMDLPRISLPFTDGPRYTRADDLLMPPDEDEDWIAKANQSYDDEEFVQLAPNNKLSVMRSPRTEEVLKNVEEALRKTDRALRDMLGLEAKKNLYGTPKSCVREAHKRISAPPPSPANFGLSTRTN